MAEDNPQTEATIEKQEKSPQKPNISKKRLILGVIFSVVIFICILAILYNQNSEDRRISLLNNTQSSKSASINNEEGNIQETKLDSNQYNLVFTRGHTENEDIQILNVISKEHISLTVIGLLTGSYLQRDYNTTFSNDKQFVFFQKDNNLWRIKVDGSNLEQLTFEGKEKTKDYWGINISFYHISYDDKKIYYSLYPSLPGRDWSEEEKKMKTPDIEQGTWMYDLESGQNHFIFSSDYSPLGWMPDSTRILIRKGYDGGTYIYNITTNKIDYVDSKTIEYASWSKVGEKGIIIYSNDYQTFLIDTQFNILETMPYGYEGRLISPNGEYVLLSKSMRSSNVPEIEYKEDHNSKVYIYNISNKKMNALPIVFTLHTKPFWSNDSQKIVYVKQIPVEGYTSIAGEYGDVFIYDIKSGKEERVTISSDFDPFRIVF